MKKIQGYYHVYMNNNWFDIVKEQVDVLIRSDLYQNSKIKVGLLYSNESDIKLAKSYFNQYQNFEISFLKPNTCFAEAETMGVLKNDCDSFDDTRYVFYMHAKGVTQYLTEKEKPVSEWRNMMEYFLLENWTKCIQKLEEGYDCCGINYQEHNANIKGQITLTNIFNGNFFWANSDYVKKLTTEILFEHRYSAEHWICSGEHQAYSFHNVPRSVNLYYDTYTEYRK